MASAAYSTTSWTPLPLFPGELIPGRRRPASVAIRLSVSKRPAAPVAPVAPANLPIRKIPGDYGLPFIGPIRDRFAYFYSEGREQFFRSRIHRYNSTVFRVNMPPGPFLAPDPRVIALLDAASFPVLFDTFAVEKRDLFTGTFMPSTDLTGGFRVLSYLDPSEPLHAPLKNLLFFLLSHRRRSIIPEFRRTFCAMFSDLESEIAASGKADFGHRNELASFDFLARALMSHDAAFEVKAGEMLFGYQPFATKDPRVFDQPEEFVGNRFVGENEAELLRYVVWSNGPETEEPTPENKQCAGKDFVVLVARLMVVEIFLRYDSFEIEVGSSALGSSVKLTSLRKASF